MKGPTRENLEKMMGARQQRRKRFMDIVEPIVPAQYKALSQGLVGFVNKNLISHINTSPIAEIRRIVELTGDYFCNMTARLQCTQSAMLDEMCEMRVEIDRLKRANKLKLAQMDREYVRKNP